MAMFDVIVSIRVTDNGVRTEKIEMKVDEKTYYKATGNVGRKELSSWAKTFFPTAEKAELLEIRRK